MASYQEHLAKQQARQAASGDVKIHFMNEFLKEDGDTAIIRFPYKSMDDIIYTATHNVPMPGAPYGRRIRCTETPDCELCAKGIKVDERVFVKFLTYTIDETSGEVVLNCTVWDRPAAFADLDLKGLMEEYGDLTQCLFKIKRAGAGKNTRYSILPVVNPVVYNPAIKDIDTRKRILFDSIHNNFKIDLTDADLDRLCHYESDKLYDFINDIKNILFG